MVYIYLGKLRFVHLKELMALAGLLRAYDATLVNLPIATEFVVRVDAELAHDLLHTIHRDIAPVDLEIQDYPMVVEAAA